jgi:hypothetical protein
MFYETPVASIDRIHSTARQSPQPIRQHAVKIRRDGAPDQIPGKGNQMDQSTILRSNPAAQAAGVPRLDIYGAVHKGLRMFLFDTLNRIGATDAGDAAQLDAHLGQTRLLLTICRKHLEHENAFVHPMLDAARPQGSRRTAEDHDEHLLAIAGLEQAIDTLEATPPALLPAALERLYLRLARFVAENLEHMEVEETHSTALLRDAFDDAEIGAMLQRLIGSIDPAHVAVFHRWMYRAMSHAELAGMFRAMRALAPAPVVDAELALAREVLSYREWEKLAQALGVPSGVVELW